jgi:hypothetical protein
LQIILPVVLTGSGAAFLVVLMGMAASETTGSMGRWAAIAEVWLVIPLLIAGLLLLLILAALIYAVAILSRELPSLARSAQGFTRRLQRSVSGAADLVVRPAISLGGVLAGARSILRRR